MAKASSKKCVSKKSPLIRFEKGGRIPKDRRRFISRFPRQEWLATAKCGRLEKCNI